MKRLLTQLQLSNYDPNGTWILECDSGFQMVHGRIREILKLNQELTIDVLGPRRETLKTQPEDVVHDVYATGRVKWIDIDVIANALATRYDFNIVQHSQALQLGNANHKQYDAVYLNDPMLLRHYKALFMLYGKYRPRYYVHSHFIDTMECPKFPAEASLWLGQCEAALKADYNFWQCGSSMEEFFCSMGKWFTQDVVDDVRAKSMPWDDGYSREEITSPLNTKNMRFTVDEWLLKTGNKFVVFFPNRISPSSGDYTNGMKFMFELLPELRKRRKDFVVVCGNPNQKFSNAELQERCGKDGYVSMVPDALNRDEYKFIAAASHVVVGLYDKDAYGGTASRECIEMGCYPLWLDLNEYRSIAQEASYPFLCKPDFSDLPDVFDGLLGQLDNQLSPWIMQERLRDVIKKRCSYEATTQAAMARMGLL